MTVSSKEITLLPQKTTRAFAKELNLQWKWLGREFVLDSLSARILEMRRFSRSPHLRFFGSTLHCFLHRAYFGEHFIFRVHTNFCMTRRFWLLKERYPSDLPLFPSDLCDGSMGWSPIENVLLPKMKEWALLHIALHYVPLLRHRELSKGHSRALWYGRNLLQIPDRLRKFRSRVLASQILRTPAQRMVGLKL